MEFLRYQPCRDEVEEELVRQFEQENATENTKKKASKKR